MPKFKTAEGKLTDYALSCGYIEAFTHPLTNIRITLWKEHSAYHVTRAYFGSRRISWESFDTLGKARAYYAAHKSTPA